METKVKTKSEGGITLVALIITIIILIILAAVTLKALFNEDLVATAIKAGEDYRRAQGEEMDQLGEINNRLVNIISGGNGGGNGEESKPNTPPVLGEVVVNRTASEMKIEAIATDKDNERLTYIVEYGTTEEYGKTATGIANSDETVTLILDGVNETDNIQWRITAKDKEVETEAKTGKSEYCSGYVEATRTCTKCRWRDEKLYKM